MTQEERAQLQKEYEELFSEIEIPDPVGYGEIEINPEDLETNKENNQ